MLHIDEVIARAGAIVAATPAPPLIDMVAAPPPSAVGARASSGPPPVVVVAGDDRYLERFLPGLAGSLRQVAGDTPLHVHAMGALRPETTDLLRSAADAISHDRTAERFSRTYYTCGRFLAAPTILAAWRRDLVIVDLDSVFAPAPARLGGQMAGGDFGFVPNNHVVPWETVDACCLYLKATPSVVAEVRLIADLIAERFAENRAEYYLDQGVLASVRHAARRRPAAPRWRPLSIKGRLAAPTPPASGARPANSLVIRPRRIDSDAWPVGPLRPRMEVSARHLAGVPNDRALPRSFHALFGQHRISKTLLPGMGRGR
ncbi:MAG: hypothetical protein VX146_06050 [Pseudomonadota bacterium]|nr:hypothetical protein [Pseudomonadota bacterium]